MNAVPVIARPEQKPIRIDHDLLDPDGRVPRVGSDDIGRWLLRVHGGIIRDKRVCVVIRTGRIKPNEPYPLVLLTL
jgi:hypothetical protein